MDATKLDSIGFDKILRKNNPFADPEPDLDLREVRFASPAGLTTLAAACISLTKTGRKPVIRLRTQDLASYLLRSGFEAIMRPHVTFSPEYKRNMRDKFDHLHGTNPVLIELTMLQTGSELPAMLDRFVTVLLYRLGYPESAAYDIAIAVSEAGQNTFEHNDGATGFMAMQIYGQRGGNQFLEIGIADCGDGFRASLSRNPNGPSLATDQDSIMHAIQLGSSEFDDPTRGRGLYHLLEIAYKYQGAVQIRSGAAVARYRMDLRRGYHIDVPAMPGVQISFTLPAAAPQVLPGLSNTTYNG